MEQDRADQIAQVTDWLRCSRRGIAFTGAGVSTESGIPDFRSPGGIWAKYQPVYYDEFMNSAGARDEYWRQKSEGHDDFARARPNVGHQLLALWQTQGRLKGVITQNIDGLHQAAGSADVLELHGTARDAVCLDCGFRAAIEPFMDQFRQTGRAPACPRCAGRLKHATISFGQSLAPEVLRAAFQWATQADLCLALGSSLVVEPAASLPRRAKQAGARLVIINRDPTPLDHLADAVFHAAIGATLSAVNAALASAGQEPG